MQLAGVMIGSDDPHKLGEFYTKVFGEPGWHDGTWYGWGEGANLMIGEHSEVHGSSTMPARLIIMIQVDDVQESFSSMLSYGAAVVAEPYQPDEAQELWLATVADPDGNYLQLSRPWGSDE